MDSPPGGFDFISLMHFIIVRLRNLLRDPQILEDWNAVVEAGFPGPFNTTDFEWLRDVLVPSIQSYPWQNIAPRGLGLLPPTSPPELDLLRLPDAVRREETRETGPKPSLRRNVVLRPTFSGAMADPTCPICQNDVGEFPHDPVQSTCCHHIFGRQCLAIWYSEGPEEPAPTTCPWCRAQQIIELNDEEIVNENAESPWWLKGLRGDGASDSEPSSDESGGE